VLTIRFDELGLRRGDRVLDVGAGFGRHAFEAARRGGRVVALDYAADEVVETRATIQAMREVGEISDDDLADVLRGDAARLPFPDGSFDVVITSEVLEHIHDDIGAITEMIRVLAPGGTFAATVPSWFPEKINWMLSDEYHAPKRVGGHVRIYTRTELRAKLRAAGFDVTHSHHAHALHSPYWWLRCLVGPQRDDHKWVARYRRFLEWDIIRQPRSTRIADRLLSPVLGKSVVLYARKPAISATIATLPAREGVAAA
jgi:SAM-dependent methyltransferase